MWTPISRQTAIAVALCLLTLHLKQALAQAKDVTWLYPPKDGLTFYYQDTVDITYESNVSLPYLGIYCLQGIGQRMFPSPERKRKSQLHSLPGVGGEGFLSLLTMAFVLEISNAT